MTVEVAASLAPVRTSALLIIPPLLKLGDAPLLGPARLLAAGRRGGHRVALLDANRDWLNQASRPAAVMRSTFLGDHDRPDLGAVEREYHEHVARAVRLPAPSVQRMTLSHREALDAARSLAASPLAHGWRERLRAEARPKVVGISVMYAGQVLAAMTFSRLVRDMWPEALIVWGGAHVTALCDEICRDAIYGELVDRYVFGYAERTWTEILDAVAGGTDLPAAACRAGAGRAERACEDGDLLPDFGDFELERMTHPTIPTQLSRGCEYGQCTYCTYPAIEGAARTLSMAPARAAVELATRCGGVVSFKDSYLSPDLLDRLAAEIAGKVRWSACTRVSAKLDEVRLRRWAKGGCATLELGVETLTEDGQRVAGKRQGRAQVLAVLDAADKAGISLVLNYMLGFPGVDRAAQERALAELQDELRRRPRLTAKIERNELQVERRAPMGRDPARFGIRIVGSWPWASVLRWEQVPGAVPEPLVKIRRGRKPTEK